MAGETEDEGSNPREEVGGLDGLVDSDDTTQADAGLPGGTGTDEGQSTIDPMGTEGDGEGDGDSEA